MFTLIFLLLSYKWHACQSQEESQKSADELIQDEKISENSLTFVTKSFCPEITDHAVRPNILYLCKQYSVIISQLHDELDNDQEHNLLLMKKFESFGLSPRMIIENDTSTDLFMFNQKLVPVYENETVTLTTKPSNLSMMNISVGWTLKLSRLDVTGYSSIEPIILVPYKVYVEFSNSLYQTKAVLSDIYAEPFLRRSICCPVSFTNVRKFVHSTEILPTTCNRGDRFLIHIFHVLQKGIIFALESFGEIKHYDLSSVDNKQLCDSVVDCETIFLLDALLTSSHLIILTNQGILVSNDLLNASNSSALNASFDLKFVPPDIDPNFQVIENKKQANLISVVGCNHLNIPDTDISEKVFFKLKNSTDVHWSDPPYENWQTFPLPEDENETLISYLYDEHQDQLIILQVTATGKVIKLRSQSTVPLQCQFIFPPSFKPTFLAVHPLSRTLFAVGNEIWVSEDSGLEFNLIHTLTDDSVKPESFSSNEKGEYVFVTENESLLYGKLGAWRLISKKIAFSNVPINGNVKYSSITALLKEDSVEISKFFKYKDDFNVTSMTYSVSEILKETEIINKKWIFIQHLNPRKSVLYQYENEEEGQRFLQEYDTGKLLKHKLGGSAIITNFVNQNPQNNFTSAVFIDWIEPFSPENKPSFEIEVNLTPEELEVKSISGGSWKKSDEGKTLVIPGYPSLFLKKYVNPQLIMAISAVNASRNFWKYGDSDWLMYSFWSEDNEPLLELSESECKIEVIVDDDKNFMIDLKDKLNITIRVNRITEGPPSNINLHATISNPKLFSITSSKSTVGNNIDFILIISTKGRKNEISLLSVNIPLVSMKCTTSLHFAVYSCCPQDKTLIFNYTFSYSKSNGAVAEDLKPTYTNLPANYRPPSKYGVDVPTSENIYNADPSLPKWQDKTLISKATGKFKQCAGKKTREECGCTEKMEMSSLAEYSDCKRRVMMIRHQTYIVFNLTLLKEIFVLDWSTFVSIEELNHRIDFSILIPENHELIPTSQQINFFSSHARLQLKGSGLYHFRVILNSGVTKCNLTDDLQVFAKPVSLPRPFYWMWNCLVIIITGVVLLASYIWYSIAHPSPNRFQRQRKGNKPSTVYSLAFA